MTEQPSTLTLKELQQQIKESIAEQFSSAIWIVAEINTISKNRNGHCYIELVQKSNTSNTIVAQARATIWANKFAYISSFFESETDYELSAGMNVMLQVAVSYHEVYGLSLNVLNINPTYTIGDMEKAKKEIIARLINEGVFDMNKALTFNPVIQNIAVVSSSTAAGYGDFVNQLENNNHGYKFNITLFDSVMQGPNTEESVLAALNAIGDNYENYDAVAIIRGGGSKNDLSWFDNYNIAYLITQFPIPIISGIGHERDESIVDMVANTRMKTPTAVAGFIIDYNSKYEELVEETSSEIFAIATEFLQNSDLYLNNITMSIMRVRTILEKNIEHCERTMQSIRIEQKGKLKEEARRLEQTNISIQKCATGKITASEKSLKALSASISTSIKHKLEKNNERLEFLSHRLILNDPRTILKRGYSISRINGKVVTNDFEVHNGDILETVLYDGNVTSVVKK